MDATETALVRVWELCDLDLTDEKIDAEIGELLPALEAAGYVETSGHSQTGLLWSFTPKGVERAEALAPDVRANY